MVDNYAEGFEWPSGSNFAGASTMFILPREEIPQPNY